MAFEMQTLYADAAEAVAAFDSARFIPIAADTRMMDSTEPEDRWDGEEIFYLPPGTEMRQLGKWRAVVNNTTNEVANIVSSRYALIQHPLVARLALEALDSTGLGRSARYEVVNGHNWVRLRARFPDVSVNDGSRGGLHLGVQFANNYAEARSFTGQMIAWRQICSNGATITRVIPGTTFNIRHVGGRAQEGRVQTEITRFVDAIANAAGRVADLIETTRATDVSFKNGREIELTIADIVDRIAAPIDIVAAIPLQTNAYDMFNAVTAFASHDPRLSNSKRELILQRAATRLLGVEEVRIITPDEAQTDLLREATTV